MNTRTQIVPRPLVLCAALLVGGVAITLRHPQPFGPELEGLIGPTPMGLVALTLLSGLFGLRTTAAGPMRRIYAAIVGLALAFLGSGLLTLLAAFIMHVG